MPEAGMSDTDMNGGPSFLTTREVAALLRVKERKVYDLAAAGDIPCRRVTGKLLFPRAEIEAWLARGGVGAAGRALPANIVAGSHDPLLDWAIRESGSGLAAYFDGSLDGLARMARGEAAIRSEEHTSELQSLMRNSYAVFCLKKKTT